MGRNTLPKALESSRVGRLHAAIGRELPQVYAWSADDQAFSAIRIYVRDDLSFLAVAKGFGSDGGAVVCFGQGVDLITTLLGLDGAIAAGNWRTDVPYGERG